MKYNAPISVLQLRSSAGLYGADRMVLALDQGLSQQGTRNRLLSINNYRLGDQPLHNCGTRAGQDVVLLPCRGKLDMRTVIALVNQIDHCKANVLHVHDYKSAFYAWLATRRRLHVKLVATLHGWVEVSFRCTGRGLGQTGQSPVARRHPGGTHSPDRQWHCHQ